LSVEVVKDILKEQNYSLEDKIIAVIGQGELIGKPITNWLEKNYKKPIIVDIGDDINKIKRADLVISGVGKSGLIDRSNLKEGANVIDFGFSLENGKISGDLAYEGLTGWYTVTPGGTGPILVAEIFKNFYKLSNK